MHYLTLNVFVKILCCIMVFDINFLGEKKKYFDPKFVSGCQSVFCGTRSTHLLKNLEEKSDLLCYPRKLQLC